MLFSYQWLKQYVQNIPEVSVLKDQLTCRSVEVEGIEPAYPLLRDVIVAQIVSVEKHPNADRLSVCQVDVGSENPLQVVCGGTNVREGMRVAFAPVGATVQWHGEGEPIVLAKATLRGVESFGMICSSNEIGMRDIFPAKEKEVLDLSFTEVAPGTPCAVALECDDMIIDIDNKSMTHRPDLFSHVGLAREIAAVFNLAFTYTASSTHSDVSSTISTTGTTTQPAVELHIADTADCDRYTALRMKVKTQESPLWMKKRLAVCGLSSINSIVDATNYVMLELGQPLHAFDARQVGKDITVRRAHSTETLIALDHKQHVLSDRNLIIATKGNPIALAGVIGGEPSAIQSDTTEIILEIAHFDPLTVRTSAQSVGVRTDSVLRFEKGPSPECVDHAQASIIDILSTVAGAQVVGVSQSRASSDVEHRPITLDTALLNRLSGMQWQAEEVVSILTRLGCAVVTHQAHYVVTPPWYRMDLRIPEDIIEELIRIYGIERVPAQKLHGQLDVAYIAPEVGLVRSLRNSLERAQFQEVYTYSFYGNDLMKRYGIESAQHVELLNPLSDDLRYCRASILPRLFETFMHNAQHGASRLFEIGHVYFSDREAIQLALVHAGPNAFRELRGTIEYLLQERQLPCTTEVITQSAECVFWNWYDGGQALQYVWNDRRLGTIGVASQSLRSLLGFSMPVAFATFSLSALIHDTVLTKPIMIPSAFPKLPLDISIIVPESVTWKDIDRVLREQGNETMQTVEVLDVYQGNQLPLGKKSISFRITFQSIDHTLQMVDMERWREAFMKTAEERYGAVLRDNVSS